MNSTIFKEIFKDSTILKTKTFKCLKFTKERNATFFFENGMTFLCNTND